jgi:hypothetical protein
MTTTTTTDRSARPTRARRSISAEQRRQVLDRHAAGETRNAIAVAVGIGAGSVSRIVTAAGGTFDRSSTEQATRARVADVRARRAEVSAALLDDVEHARAVLRRQEEPHALMLAAKAVASLVGAHGRAAELVATLDAGTDVDEGRARIVAFMDVLRTAGQRDAEESAA